MIFSAVWNHHLRGIVSAHSFPECCCHNVQSRNRNQYPIRSTDYNALEISSKELQFSQEGRELQFTKLYVFCKPVLFIIVQIY